MPVCLCINIYIFLFFELLGLTETLVGKMKQKNQKNTPNRLNGRVISGVEIVVSLLFMYFPDAAPRPGLPAAARRDFRRGGRAVNISKLCFSLPPQVPQTEPLKSSEPPNTHTHTGTLVCRLHHFHCGLAGVARHLLIPVNNCIMATNHGPRRRSKDKSPREALNAVRRTLPAGARKKKR